MKLTHKGWWLFCPILIGDLETGVPLVVPRWFWCFPLYWMAQGIQSITITLCSFFFEDYQPSWSFLITGEL